MIIAAVCARGGSKGVPRKNLRSLGGKPLLAYTVEQACSCGLFDHVIVSTDDPEIEAVARSYGAESLGLRPAELAQDNSPKWPVFQHIVKTAEQAYGARVTLLADLDTGTPLRSDGDVKSSLDTLLGSQADVVITAYQPERNPYFNMVEVDGEYARLVKSSGRTVTRRQDAPAVFSLSPAVFAMRRDFILSASHWSEGRVKIVELPRERAIDIDHEIDFQFVEYLMSHPNGAT